jgi:hypothetical protein
MKNYRKTAKFFANQGLDQRYCAGFKGTGTTFDLSPEWQRTLPFFGNFSWDIYRVPKKSKYQS